MPDSLIDEITERILSAAPSLTSGEVKPVVAERVRNAAQASRLLAALTADPTLPTSASSGMPRMLQRIIADVISMKASELRLPRCPRCGREWTEGFVGTHRLCGTCAHGAAKRLHQCAACGKNVLNVRNGAGHDYCPPCWRAMAADRSRIIRSALLGARLDVPEQVISHALVRTASTSTEGLKFALELQLHAERWFSNPATGTPAFLKFYVALSAVLPGLPAPRCGQCGEERPLTNNGEGARVCQRCYRRRFIARCDGCGRDQPIVRRLPGGDKLCQTCHKRRPENSGACLVCGQLRQIAHRSTLGPTCGPCRFRGAVDTCRTCGRTTPCRFAGTDRAICEVCRRVRVSCSRCGHRRLVHTRDEAGAPLCDSCTDRLPEECHVCGNLRRVVSRVDGRPLCDTCNRRHPVSFRDCSRCGRHTRIRRNGLCHACAIHDLVEEMFPPEILEQNAAARALRDALRSTPEARSVHDFLRPQSIRLLRNLLNSAAPWSHEMIDALGSDTVTRGMRDLLVEYGLLEPVDIHLRRFEASIPVTAAGVEDAGERAAFIQYATWKHLRELRALPGPISPSRASSRRRELRIVVDLLSWARQQGTCLRNLTQADLDRWSLTAPERHRAMSFLRWARRNRLTGDLSIRQHRHADREMGGLTDEERARLLAKILGDEAVLPSTKLAAALVLCYALRPHQIVATRLSQIHAAQDGMTYLRVGEDAICLPDELGIVAGAVVTARAAPRILHIVEDHDWLFPGERAGYPLTSKALRRRLSRLGVPTASARKGAIVSLAAEVHPVVLANLIGLHVRTAIQWRDATAASRRNYVRELQRGADADAATS